MPKYITPLTAPQHQILELYMGVNGKRLNQTEMEARGYTMVIAELQTIIHLPVGGPDGYYKVGQYYLGSIMKWLSWVSQSDSRTHV